MRHRLLHTLVFSSGFLLDGCATTHGTMPDAGPLAPDAPPARDDAALPPDAAVIGDAFVAPDAAAPPDAFVAPDAFSADASVSVTDPRACEPGWPTTKAVFDVERDGVWYGCRFGVTDPESPDLSLCCIIVREAP